MKKNIIITTAFLLLFSLTLHGCTAHRESQKAQTSIPAEQTEPQNGDYTVYVCDLSDSAGLIQATSVSSYDLYDEEKYTDDSIPKTKTLEIHGESVAGVYSGISRPVPDCEYYPSYRYAFNHGIFGFTPDGVLKIYIRTPDSFDYKDKETITQEEAMAIAKDVFAEVLGDYSSFQTQAKLMNDGSYNYYRILFYKTVDGIQTAERVEIEISKIGGELGMIRTNMYGRIPSDIRNPFDMTKAEEALFETVDKMVVREVDNYKITGVMLTVLEDGSRALFYYVEIRYKGSGGEVVTLLVTE